MCDEYSFLKKAVQSQEYFFQGVLKVLGPIIFALRIDEQHW